MAQLTDVQLLAEKEVIKNETATNANTATRIGQMLEDIIDSKPNVSAVPNADSSNRGIAKLYTSTGANTDGSMDQNSITNLFGASGPFVDSEVPSGSVNSSNVTFTLANTPIAGSVKLYQNGIRLKVTTDYTISTNTITFLTAPTTGDLLLADYRK